VTPAESLLSQIDALEARCNPSHFGELFRRVVEFRDLLPALKGVDKDSRNWAVEKLRAVARRMSACMNEAFVAGQLNATWESSQPDEIEEPSVVLFRALHTPDLRERCLWTLLSCCLAFAASLSLRCDPTESAYWGLLLDTIAIVPPLAKLAAGEDVPSHRRQGAEKVERAVQDMRDEGYEPVDPDDAIRLSVQSAWEGWIEAGQVRGAHRISILDNAAARLRLALNFMLLPGTEPWELGPLVRLYEGASMTAMVRELGRHRLRLLEGDQPQIDRFWNWTMYQNVHHGIPLRKHCELRVGIIRRQKYFVGLPDVDCLSTEFTLAKLDEWNRDPVRYMRRNIVQIPTSLRTRRLRLYLDIFERELTDAKLENWFATNVEEIAPETLALVIAESAGLPHAVALPLGFFFRNVVRYLQTRRE
jgi:hypothetical protein